MPRLEVNAANLWYEESGSGPECLVFAHGFLMDHTMFDAQVRSFEDSYRCVRYDHRGQGRSEVAPAGYDMDSLATDAAELISRLGCAPCHFVGLSMGGFVGLRLALERPGLLRSLTLVDTSADPEPSSSRLRYSLMARLAGWLGFRPLVRPISRIMFGRSFRRDPARRAELRHWRDAVLAADREGILRAVGGVLHREGVRARLPEIRVPTLIIVGEEDRATPPFRARRMNDLIPGSVLAVIPGAGHSSTIEQPQLVSAAMRDFLRGSSAVAPP